MIGIDNFDLKAVSCDGIEACRMALLKASKRVLDGNFIEASHLGGRAHLIELIRIFEKERPDVPMRVDHGRLMLDDAEKGYNPGYSFHGRMLALAQVEGMMAVVKDELHGTL